MGSWGGGPDEKGVLLKWKDDFDNRMSTLGLDYVSALEWVEARQMDEAVGEHCWDEFQLNSPKVESIGKLSHGI